jgi:Tfp pilus assembly protein PilF
LLGLAETLYDAARYAEARTYAEAAVERERKSKQAWLVLGNIRKNLDDRTGARKAYGQAAFLGSARARAKLDQLRE